MPSKPTKNSVSVIKSSVSKQSYQKLLAILRAEIEHGQTRIERYITFEKIRTNWAVGRHIHSHLLDGEGRAPQGKFLYARLSEDLNISVRHLQDIVRFYRLYPKMPVNTGLSWTHYHTLLTVSDPSERKRLEERVIKEKISVPDLRLLVHAPDAPVPVADRSGRLKYDRGALYACHIIKVNTLHEENFLTLDCGFAIDFYKALDTDAIYRSGNICLSTKHNEEYSLKIANQLRAGDLYTYRALVERFIDGDTLLVNVDAGFGIWTHQKLRFRGIDCPELGTVAGERAKKFVEEQLRPCPFVVIKTYKSDKFDRYLVDVFYLAGEEDALKVAAEGKYLNQELINCGLAKVWES